MLGAALTEGIELILGAVLGALLILGLALGRLEGAALTLGLPLGATDKLGCILTVGLKLGNLETLGLEEVEGIMEGIVDGLAVLHVSKTSLGGSKDFRSFAKACPIRTITSARPK